MKEYITGEITFSSALTHHTHNTDDSNAPQLEWEKQVWKKKQKIEFRQKSEPQNALPPNGNKSTRGEKTPKFL